MGKLFGTDGIRGIVGENLTCLLYTSKGDTITTIGGIIGRVVQVNKDTLVIETSEDRVRMEVTKWAISTTGVQTTDQPVDEKSDKKKKDVYKRQIWT